MISRLIIPGIALVVACVMLVAAFLSPLALFVKFGLPPCAEEGWFKFAAEVSIPLSLSAGGIWLLSAARPGAREVAIAIAIPCVALVLYWQSERWNAPHQQACAHQTLEQAVAACRADRSVYRAGRSPDGFPTFTLVAPGNTDHAYDCLWRWSIHKGSVEINVDESVYEEYRRTRAPG
ncbi:hypothetical protein [Sphingomonas sp.]|uniref:hypothetical protein n=1 Tax=Sphingomonas sp. TaxID=28214 RepID=UPI003D6D7F23